MSRAAIIKALGAALAILETADGAVAAAAAHLEAANNARSLSQADLYDLLVNLAALDAQPVDGKRFTEFAVKVLKKYKKESLFELGSSRRMHKRPSESIPIPSRYQHDALPLALGNSLGLARFQATRTFDEQGCAAGF